MNVFSEPRPLKMWTVTVAHYSAPATLLAFEERKGAAVWFLLVERSSEAFSDVYPFVLM